MLVSEIEFCVMNSMGVNKRAAALETAMDRMEGELSLLEALALDLASRVMNLLRMERSSMDSAEDLDLSKLSGAASSFVD